MDENLKALSGLNEKTSSGLDIVIEEEKGTQSDVVDVKSAQSDDRLGSPLNMNRLLLSTQNSAPLMKNYSSIVVKCRKPSESFLISYTAPSTPAQIKMEISPQLVSTLQASKEKVPRRPSVRRSTVTSISKKNSTSSGPFDCLPLLDAHISSSRLSKPKKKVRFRETVTIHRISVHRGSAAPPTPEMFLWIISLKEIWKYVDLDKDKHLNMKELRRFADKVWEDEDVEDMMSSYASKPDKGLSFGEWCAVLKEEDNDMTELIDDLYDIFVEDAETEDDEKEA